MSVTSTLLLRGLARGKARFACAALGVAAAAGAVVFVFSLAAGVLLSALASMQPSWSASRMAPVEAMRVE